MDEIRIFTIGFTGSSAEHFFGRLTKAGVRKLIDTRRWPGSQLSGFARKQDLPYFLKTLAGCGYEHRQELAPSEDILKDYKDKKIDWPHYERRYLALLTQRGIAGILCSEEVHKACFLCAEATAECCHRRLLAEYLQREWGVPIAITHL